MRRDYESVESKKTYLRLCLEKLTKKKNSGTKGLKKFENLQISLTLYCLNSLRTKVYETLTKIGFFRFYRIIEGIAHKKFPMMRRDYESVESKKNLS